MVSNLKSSRIVEAVGLTKIFKDFWMRSKAKAVDNLSFHIEKGELFGLLGPNGSGKSTTIKLILGLLNRTRGRLSVFGREPHDVAVKKYIGFLPEESYLYQYLNSRETLDYYGRLFGLERATRRKRIEELLEWVGLSQVAHRPVGEFSKGMMRRIGLAQALINDPDFLILDEPTSGLDPIGTRQVKDLLVELRSRGKTILLSSHLLADVEDVCDRLVILYGGSIRAEGTADALLTDSSHTVLQIPRIHNENTITEIDKVLLQNEGASIESVTQPRQKLESLFLKIVEDARLEQAATSGALHGGETASFLRAGANGEGLIDQLLQERETEKSAVEVDTPKHEHSEPEILEELVKDENPSENLVDEAKTELDTPKGADSSVIDSLLDQEPDDTKGTK
ncbi:MAG: ABC transporter ATP-binding protein [Phycisphaerales bacterium]|jgi:ABC-2 type transport system ATP-binding protein|nr:ABC transporter ATP-binding protein [Phycisphaerales bacterium]